jgi:hypothetical protein
MVFLRYSSIPARNGRELAISAMGPRAAGGRLRQLAGRAPPDAHGPAIPLISINSKRGQDA